jgi:hypothetical protein
VTGPRGADGSLRANRFGSVATNPSWTAEGVCLVELPGTYTRADLRTVDLAAQLVVGLGLGRIVALYFRSSTLSRNR